MRSEHQKERYGSSALVLLSERPELPGRLLVMRAVASLARLVVPIDTDLAHLIPMERRETCRALLDGRGDDVEADHGE